jgi:hypothetical protein
MPGEKRTEIREALGEKFAKEFGDFAGNALNYASRYASFRLGFRDRMPRTKFGFSDEQLTSIRTQVDALVPATVENVTREQATRAAKPDPKPKPRSRAKKQTAKA